MLNKYKEHKMKSIRQKRGAFCVALYTTSLAVTNDQ